MRGGLKSLLAAMITFAVVVGLFGSKFFTPDPDQEALKNKATLLDASDDNSRYRALETAICEGIPIDRDLLEEILINDSSELVRMTAF